MKITCFILTGALLSQSALGIAGTQTEIWEKLKRGGLVVLMKHTAVPEDSAQAANLFLRDPSCKNERNLSAEGKTQAIKIGEKFVNQKVSVEKVLNSPYCRTTDTAMLSFKSSNPTDFLTLPMELSPDQGEKHQSQLKAQISSFSGKGNLILITHDVNISSISFETIKRNTALVVQPMGAGGFEELGTIQIFD